jgi:hypothetical protein
MHNTIFLSLAIISTLILSFQFIRFLKQQKAAVTDESTLPEQCPCFFSFGNVLAFIACASWSYLLVRGIGFDAWIACLVAIGDGLFLAFMLYYMKKTLFRFQKRGILDYINAVDHIATVASNIPPLTKRGGRINFTFNQKNMDVEAIHTGDFIIEANENVRIKAWTDSKTFLVEKI